MRILPVVILCFLISSNSFGQTGKLTVYFAFNSAELSATETGRLDSFVQSTQKIPMMVSGHTDSRGSDAYNDALSKRRADAVKTYLEADGFSVNNEKAFGETKLIVPDRGDKIQGAANRRVEVSFEIPEVSIAKSETPIPEERMIKELIGDEAAIKGTTLTLRNLHFVGGMHRLLPASKPELESLLDALKSNPKLKISIEGHICCLPDDQDGLDFETHTEDLSKQRAKAVYDYLIEAGIDKNRLRFRGFGHKVPLYPFPERNSDEQIANRRVEVRILEK